MEIDNKQLLTELVKSDIFQAHMVEDLELGALVNPVLGNPESLATEKRIRIRTKSEASRATLRKRLRVSFDRETRLKQALKTVVKYMNLYPNAPIVGLHFFCKNSQYMAWVTYAQDLFEVLDIVRLPKARS